MLYTAWGTIIEPFKSKKETEPELNPLELKLQEFRTYRDNETTQANSNNIFFADAYKADYNKLNESIKNLNINQDKIGALPDMSAYDDNSKLIMTDVSKMIKNAFSGILEQLHDWMINIVSIIVILIQKVVDETIKKYYRVDPPYVYIEKIKVISDYKYIYGIETQILLQALKLSLEDPLTKERLPEDKIIFNQSLLNRLRLQLIEFENYPNNSNYIITRKLIFKLIESLATLPESYILKSFNEACFKFLKDEKIKDNLVPDLDFKIYKKPKIV